MALNVAGGPIANVETATETLGRTLYYQLERLDPALDERKWDDLGPEEQDVYRLAMRATLRLGRRAVLELFSCDDEISRRTNMRE